jgi:hypothetical protein
MHWSFVPLPVPDPITFVISPEYLDRRLYPRQATILKVLFLRVDLLTDYDLEVIAEWEENFRLTGNNGMPPGVIARMQRLKSLGYRWFREALLVMGRRAGKGYLCALAMSYVLWNYMSKGDPQEFYGIDRDKRLTCLIYAGRKDQAKDNLWRDLYQVINGGSCFKPYLGKMMGESFSIFAPADKLKRRALARRGVVSGIDQATFKIDPLPATPMSGRGGASFMIGMDEMAHMVASGANRSSEELWVAATPALDQFKRDAFIACPSSPWEMTGQFYVEWQHSQEIDEATGLPAYPEIFMIQLTSWDPYVDWERAHEIDLFPEDFIGDLDEYLDESPPRLAQLKSAVQEYDDAMRRLEKADPDMFSVERLSHWQTSLNAYLDPKMIAAMFDHMLPMVTTGKLSYYYKGHADPSIVNDNFGFAVAHTEKNDDGFEVVIFDHIHHWNPADYPGNKLDYVQINEHLWEFIRSFPLDDLSFDQFNSAYFEADLTQKVRAAQIPKRVNVHVVPATAPYNFRVAETFKVALNQGWVKAPYYEQADLELRFLQMKNGKVTHQTAGPVQHDDVARSMMEVVFGLLERQVSSFLTTGAAPLSPSRMGGNRPWMQPSSQDAEVFRQFGEAHAHPRGSNSGPARGKSVFGPGARVPGRAAPGYGRR